ncbi:hypothetical protein DPEC_G00247540 [Dallia pectoralis]|uniref:Uncharacterized protein n=1 Tax=Dallia pectoralis TaxID=75939 RepID=A0ACC2FWH7_DALPE|nr:hypothetical protein DPEC_G00247540 [Dallia pectoralis]
MIDFVIVSADLRPHVLDTRVKRGAELSTDHHLVVLGASRGGNPRTPWWTTVVREAVPEDSGGSCWVPTGPKKLLPLPCQRQSSGCGRSLEKLWRRDFRSAPRCFWKTVRHLRRGKPGTIQAVYSKDGTLLTSTDDVIGRWKEHFEELLNPTYMPSSTEAELEADGGHRQFPWGKSLRLSNNSTVAKPQGLMRFVQKR